MNKYYHAILSSPVSNTFWIHDMCLWCTPARWRISTQDWFSLPWELTSKTWISQVTVIFTVNCVLLHLCFVTTVQGWENESWLYFGNLGMLHERGGVKFFTKQVLLNQVLCAAPEGTLQFLGTVTQFCNTFCKNQRFNDGCYKYLTIYKIINK